MSAFHNNVLIGSSSQSSYTIERSLRFNSVDSAYLNRTPASAGSQTTWTWSAWIKRAALGATANRLFGTGDNSSATNQTSINLSSDSLDFYNVNGGYKTTTAKFRDPSAWYHVVVAWDSNNATASDRIRLYVNGARLTAFSSSTDPSSGTNTVVNSAVSHTIGTLPTNSGNYFDGYLTEIHFIDGQALTPSSFGETDTITGVWKPKKYDGTYGTNGFYLNFADNSGTTSTTLGKDSSGNGNNWTPNNFSVTAGSGNDSMIDTPTPYADGGNGRGNYCTWNPLDKNASTTLSDGNLYLTPAASSTARATIGVSTGLWYYECTVGSVASNTIIFGYVDSAHSLTNLAGYGTYGVGYYGFNGNVFINGSSVATLSTCTQNDIIGVAVDLANNKIWFSKNGTWMGTGTQNPATNQGGISISGRGTSVLFPAAGSGTPAAGASYFNFGQRDFAYTPPSGFKALNTQNLPEPSIKKPSSYMDVVTYTGTGSALTPTTGIGFSPDLVWIKSRSAATDHALYDAVRGTEKRLESNNTDAEVTSDGGVTAFNSAGFTLGTLAQVNTNTATYAAWCWDESATPGFDIVTYTGTGSVQTIAHSLGVAPSMMIVKERSNANDWPVYHASTGNLKALYLNLINGQGGDFAGAWNSTSPTSSVFSLGTSVETNRNTGTFVAYLWSEVAGFSKFGSYTGNNSMDGPFVYCGFRPRWVMFKRSDGVSNWMIIDAARNTANVIGSRLFTDVSDAESSGGTTADFTANGFKLRSLDTPSNGSTGTYIFAAFAESPFKYSLAR